MRPATATTSLLVRSKDQVAERGLNTTFGKTTRQQRHTAQKTINQMTKSQKDKIFG
jgi:hypothetical protein